MDCNSGNKTLLLALLIQVFLCTCGRAQTISWEYLAPLPERVTNNAIATASHDGETYIYTFTGIDTTLSCAGDHLRAYRYTLGTNQWDSLPTVPDPLGGKVAAGASTIDGKVYVIGGYHIQDDCREVSSVKTSIFDPVTNAWLPDGADIPVAIDDHVQAVYQDSLLFVVTGWSNTRNVANVQIYDPANDQWQVGTSVPFSNAYRAFGASGTIIGDTLYYAGGASDNGSFPATNFLRKGYINPEDPTDITWGREEDVMAKGYRMGAATFEGKALWFGGSDVTYNFDALAYTNGAVVAPLDRITVYDPNTGALTQNFGQLPALMDLRGVAELGDGVYLFAGGLLADQEVSNQLLKVTITDLTSVSPGVTNGLIFKYFPNPTQKLVQLDFSTPLTEEIAWEVMDANGRRMINGRFYPGSETSISLVELPAGSYFLRLEQSDGTGLVTRIIRSL